MNSFVWRCAAGTTGLASVNSFAKRALAEPVAPCNARSRYVKPRRGGIIWSNAKQHPISSPELLLGSYAKGVEFSSPGLQRHVATLGKVGENID